MKICQLLSILLILLSIPVTGRDPAGGSLVIIGGALDPGNQAVYQSFIRLGGGKRAIHIAIIPAASATPVQTGQTYMKDFIRYGVSKRQIQIVPLALLDDPASKETDESQWAHNAWKQDVAESLTHVTAVFFVGGDKMRYRITLKDKEGNDSPLLTAIRDVYRRGGVIGGTSAGAAIMSDPMLIGGLSVSALGPRRNEDGKQTSDSSPVPMKPGMGFFSHGLVDQHFIKRGRLGRLIAALLTLENVSLGFGIDEDTAILAQGDMLEVTGSSGVFMMDISQAKHRLAEDGVFASGIRLHYLGNGDSYNTKTKAFSIHPARKPIEPGKEYYKESILTTDIFYRDAAFTLVTQGLIDNTANEATGIAFTLGAGGSGSGSKLVFRKDDRSRGYWGRTDGLETYSALNVILDICPIQITIKEAIR